jgi:hypothetical protein
MPRGPLSVAPFAIPASQKHLLPLNWAAFETPMPRRSIIWLVTDLDQQVTPVWIIPIAPLAVSWPQLGFAYPWYAQCAHDGIVKLLGSANVSDRDGNVIKMCRHSKA